MVDGFFFSRQKAPVSSSSLNTPGNSSSTTPGLAEMASSAAFQASSSSHFEADLKLPPSMSNEELSQNRLLAESSEPEEGSNSRYKRYLNAGFAGPKIVSNNLDRFEAKVRELVTFSGEGGGGGENVSNFINKSLNRIHQNSLMANSGRQEEDMMKARETSNFHYIEPDFLVAPPQSNSGAPAFKSQYRIPSKNDSSTLLNNSVNGSLDEAGEVFFGSSENKTTGLDEISNNFEQQQPSTELKFNLNYNIERGANNNNYPISNILLDKEEVENSRISYAFEDVGQFTSWAPSLGEIFTQNLNSFSDLFSSLLESERQYDEFNDLLTYSMRCRKLTWDYVTELSKLI